MSVEGEIAEELLARFHEWAKYLSIDGEQRRVVVQRSEGYPSAGLMEVELEGIGLFEMAVNVKCVATAKDITEAGGRDHLIAEREADEFINGIEVRADRLAEGDEIWSDATKRWHRVVEASTYRGVTTLVIMRDETHTFRFQPAPDTLYRTRRGETGRAAGLFDDLGGEVIHSA